MNLLLISDDDKLKKELKQTGLNLTTGKDLSEQYMYEVIVICDKKISYNELTCSIDSNEDNKKILKHVFYILSEGYSELTLNNIQIMCKTKGIMIFKPDTSISLIVKKILLSITPKLKSKSKNVITFFGADSKVGTTMIAHSVAEALAKITDIKIGLLFLNDRPSTYYIKKSEICGLDDIKIKLFNNILHSEEIVEACIKEENDLYLLPGVDYIPEIRQYHPEHIRKLIDLASEKFNLIIIDAGSSIDSGLAIASLTSTNNKFLVTTQQDNARNNYQRIESQVFKKLNINENEFMLIINKYIKSPYIYTEKQIANLFNLILATHVPYMDLMGWQSEAENKTLLHYGNESYNNQIYKIAKLIVEQANIPYKTEKQKKDGIIKKVISSFGGII